MNNHRIRLEALGGQDRVSHFVRDPRDVVVSGYLYHKAGGEEWSRTEEPSTGDWTVVNGCLPDSIGPGQSFATFLQSCPKEDDLIAEIQFRRRHFEAMGTWREGDRRVLTMRYEDIVDREAPDRRPKLIVERATTTI